MTAPALRAIANNGGGGADADPVTVCTNVDGDLLLFVEGNNNQNSIITTGMDAWTRLYDSFDVGVYGLHLFHKTASSEPATYAPLHASGANTRWMFTMSFQGVHATPIEDYDIASDATNTTTTLNSTAVTSSGNERLHVIIGLARLGGADPLWNDISGMTTHFNDTGFSTAIIVASEVVGAGSHQKTLSHNGTAVNMGCFSLILTPAVEGTPASVSLSAPIWFG